MKSPVNSKRGRTWLIAGIAACTLGMVYYFADPIESRWMPHCLFHTLTGWDCPGCGAQRMIHALAHGEWHQAWEANPFLICMMPVIAVGIWADLRPGMVRQMFYHPVVLWGLCISILGWGILRNLL